MFPFWWLSYNKHSIALTRWHFKKMVRSWRTDEWQRLGWSRSRWTTSRFLQKRKWRDRHKAPAHRGRAETTRQLRGPFIFLQLLRKSLHLSWDWWSGVWCDVHTSHPTSSTKTIPDPGSVQQQLQLQRQRVWRQLPDSALLQMVPSRGGAVLWRDLRHMKLHIYLSRDLPR